jgi:DNA replication protein DnaC
MTRIDETLKKIAEDMSRANTQTSSSTESPRSNPNLPGDPDCPICGGVGHMRQDLPITDPNFGKLVMCSCLARKAHTGAQSRLLRLSNLEALKDKTFDSFLPEGLVGADSKEVSSLEMAYRFAQQYAQELRGWFLLMGGYGSGKTHLAAAIANAAIERGVETLFLTVPDLLDWLRYSYDAPDTSFEQRFEEIRNVPLLILDDLGTQNATPWAEEKLFQIINYRYVQRQPTVVTTNLDLVEIDGRISSRLLDPQLVDKIMITAPDYRRPAKGEGQSMRTDLALLADFTFGAFSLREFEKLDTEVRANLEKVYRSVQQYAENPTGWLVISGGYFCGKTHLAAAIGNYRAKNSDRVSFWVVAELLDHLRATFSPNSSTTYDHLFEEVRNASLLILDDYGGQSSTPWAQEKMYQILNFRYNASLPTVITTTKKLDEIEPRVRSRMMDRRRCVFLALQAPAYIPNAPGKSEPRGRAKRAS